MKKIVDLCSNVPMNNIGNKFASQFMSKECDGRLVNWDKLRNYLKGIVAKKGNKGDFQFDDLLTDVYMSFIVSEERGDGFKPEKGLTVAQFVYGRVQKYARNRKYWSGLECRGNEVLSTVASASENLEYIYENAAQQIDNMELVEIETDLSSYVEAVLTAEYTTGLDLRGLIINGLLNIKHNRLISKKDEKSIIEMLRDILQDLPMSAINAIAELAKMDTITVTNAFIQADSWI